MTHGYQPKRNSPKLSNHAIMRDTDEYYCPRCGCRWGIKEPAPEKCIQSPPRKP